MSLRARLVLALGLLLLIGLGAFGLGAYARYSASERATLDDRLRTLGRDAEGQLLAGAGLGESEPDTGESRQGPPRISLSGAYAELRDATGTPVYSLASAQGGPKPSLPAEVTLNAATTVGSTTGDVEWRILATPTRRPAGYTVVVAVPMADVDRALRELVIIEAVAGAALLAVLSAGAWLILRRGLRPLEHMATQARSISAGDLGQRVAPADGRSEVGQLGQALNSMLGDLEQAFRRRDETEHTLRQFLADAAHELRTPLTSIRGFAELSRLDPDRSPVDQSVLMQRIEEESLRMKRLVDDLLLLARLDRTAPAEHSAVDLAVLAADACTDFVAADPARPVSLDAPEPVIVHGVTDHLRQAIANVMANARRHTPPGTPVEVTVRSEGDDAVLSVRDHGAGLSEGAVAHAFDRFWQADAARAGAGSGLGLSIVAGIAAEHGGSAVAANAADGRGGAVFTLRLPLRPAGAPSPDAMV